VLGLISAKRVVGGAAVKIRSFGGENAAFLRAGPKFGCHPDACLILIACMILDDGEEKKGSLDVYARPNPGVSSRVEARIRAALHRLHDR
jgi:hypothetical protein